MTIANYHHLGQLIGVVNTLEASELPDVQALGLEPACRQLAMEWIKPDFEKLDEKSRHACRNSLRYFLTTKNAPFDQILDSQQEFCWDVSDSGASFFEWIWETIYPNEDYVLTNLDDWEEQNSAANAMLTRM